MKSVLATLARLVPGGLLAVVLAVSAPARAASVLPLYLDQIVDHAAVAFEGTCIDNRVERDPETNMVVTYTTFAVRDVLKGEVGFTHVIKQAGGELPDGGLQYSVKGVPKFAAGQDYVVFLAGVSSAGFSSPIGLAQGQFRIRPDGAQRKVTNGRDFREMTETLAERLPAQAKSRLQQAPGPVREMDLEAFKETVRNHLGGGR